MKRIAFVVVNIALVATLVVALVQLDFGSARGVKRIPLAGSDAFIRGDSNADGSVDIADPLFTLEYLFTGGDAPDCLAAADADDSAALDLTDGIYTLAFLFLGGPPPPAPHPVAGSDPTPDLGCRGPALPPLPAVGSPGGPDRTLTAAEALSWRRGRALFVQPTAVAQGLGPLFNGDSCRSCHLDPAFGGAGGLDLSVVRYARRDENGALHAAPGGPAASRQSLLSFPRDEIPPEANVIETRQTPSAFGLGLVDEVPDAEILSAADPDDADGDGISGRARIVNGRAGRFGHKCGVPTLNDFTADALFNEVGLTIDASLSAFATSSDMDNTPDPELSESDFRDLVFFVSRIAPPARRLPVDAAGIKRLQDGEDLFRGTGCGACHRPSLAGPRGPVGAYADFLLHDVADPSLHQVDEPGVAPREFRTSPLWGVRDTGPYLHDGSAETLEEAVSKGHFGEASASRTAFLDLPLDERAKLVEFLESL